MDVQYLDLASGALTAYVEYETPDRYRVKIPLETGPGTRVGIVLGLRPSEPIFVLRGQDAIALATLNLWAQMSGGTLDLERAADLERARQDFITWRKGEGRAHVKDAD